ncbi:MAG: arginine biosynthesis bifunctional protein ArgJ [Gammaproteobacteria bacterium]|nr:MAG: arginine biosynthesis bifunctional protein ArgJ [Gammaproteobacteria bacterium]
MAVGLDAPGRLLAVAGLRLATTAAGLRRRGGDDLLLVELAEGSAVAAVFTRNRFCAAPVRLARSHLAAAVPRFLLINAGNANAGTGRAGLEDARRCCAAVAERAGLALETVLPFSTGVIGERLPVDRVLAALPALFAGLTADGWGAAARAIMTTDTVPKGLSLRVDLPGGAATVTGIAKGAGMICPNMATMLAFIATDARIEPRRLAALHRRLVAGSFNRITVDGDTSTNDAALLIATGRGPAVPRRGPAAAAFEAALAEVYRHLAQAIVRDGEGATRFVAITVRGAAGPRQADAVARAVAHSPLVKTALYAGDPNWGRILAAVGRAGVAGVDAVSLAINGVSILRGGEPDPGYSEAAGQAALSAADIAIDIDLGAGSGEATVWTCDLTEAYVRINADYRT